MPARVLEVRIKDGMPSVAEARRRLENELASARARGVRVLKLIHGYGSTGVGGKLRRALRRSLEELQATGAVRRVVPGEAWDLFDATSLALRDAYPELRDDPDFRRGNAGVTIVELA